MILLVCEFLSHDTVVVRLLDHMFLVKDVFGKVWYWEMALFA